MRIWRISDSTSWRGIVPVLVTTAMLLAGRAEPGLAAPGSAASHGSSSALALTATCNDGWSKEVVALPWTSVTSVAAVGDHLWAAGFTKLRHDIRRPTLLRRSADAWATVRLPAVGRETGLFDVAGAWDGAVWAVGYESVDRLYRPYVAHGRSGGMSRVPGPATGTSGASLTGVLATPGGVVAVGFSVGGRGEIPVVARRARTGWSVSRLQGLGGSGALLTVARAGGHTWAAGWLQAGTGVRPLIVTDEGSGWRRVESPPGAGAILDLATDAAGRLWAVGYRLVGGRQQPAAWWRRDDGWTALPALVTGHALAFLTGVEATSVGVVVAGGAFEDSTGRWLGVTGRWNGQGWQSAPASRQGADLILHDVATARDESEPTVVGQVGKRPLVMRWCGPTAAIGARGGERERRVAGSIERSRADAPRRVTSRSGAPVVARDVTRRAGLVESTQTHGGLVADLDRNGWPDLFISRHGGPAKLMLNVGGRFKAPAGAPFPKGDRHACSAADANGDGSLDIYCAFGADRGAGFKTNELWIRHADGTYSDEAAGSGVADPFGRGRVATFFDLDHDRWPDLFVGNKVPRTDGLPGPSVVLARPQGGTYEARSTAGFDASMGAVCLHAADVDGDGWQDLVLCRRNLNRSGGFGIAWLRNEHGVLRDRTAWLGLPNRVTMDVLPVDLDRDGRLDLVEVTPNRMYVHLRRGGGYATGAEASLIAGRAVAAGDVDGDGDPDLYVVQGASGSNPPDRVFVVGAAGGSLRQMAVPGTTAGGADTVVAIDYDRNGLSDFLVLNGSHGAGPIKLIGFYRR